MAEAYIAAVARSAGGGRMAPDLAGEPRLKRRLAAINGALEALGWLLTSIIALILTGVLRHQLERD